MALIEIGQTRRLYQLLRQTGLEDEKASLVKDASNGRTESTKALYQVEAQGLIKRLEGMLPSPAPAGTGQARDAADVMRKKIFSLCREMGYISGFSGEDKQMNKAVVYGLVERIGYAKKPLMAYAASELPKLVSQFESMMQNNNKAAASKAVCELKKELGL